MDPVELQANLRTSLRYLKGVGPERYRILNRLGLETVGDLFYFFPRRHENRSPVKRISELDFGDKECIRGRVMSRGLVRLRNGPSIFRVVLSEADGARGARPLFATWFNQPYLAKVFLPKSAVILYGKAEKKGREIQMIHPEYEIIPEGAGSKTIHFGRLAPIYPLTEDLSQKAIRQLAFGAVGNFSALLKDSLPAPARRRLGLKDTVFAFQNIHFPESEEDYRAAYRRLVFDEFFRLERFIQARRRMWQKEDPLLSHRTGEEEVGKFVESLGFSLTPGQAQAIRDILSDMKGTVPMRRLVQGDVGSGKTVVAAAALVFTAMNGFQGAFMAPTEVLAQQHFMTLSALLEPMGITCGYLAQHSTPEEKRRVLDGLASGEIGLAIGTHALIQESVRFKKLGLAVVDEQHKFGVFQRAALKKKAERPVHFLLLTATPIPRTLALTLYGDLEISVIAERPVGRAAVQTFWVAEEKRREIYHFMETAIGQGRQAYVICPLIEGGSESRAKSVTRVFEEFSRIFPLQKTGLLHGRMKSDDKRKVMKDFKERKTDILISTVVIEVGVDVPNAALMLIENAERFGLAQLHQLRGRIGRGAHESFCFLFSQNTNEETAERLRVFEETPSGFEIAEKDLAMRGAGQILGRKQHGLPELRIGDLAKDLDILEMARREAAHPAEAKKEAPVS
ncbi:MAG: ATP-dependent DNA helicase RecG [Candidatus Omnitrophica bacterium]|nr:ATP-dependent DNA helicase RecG [Candidatus Omnitrophota bacterium]